MARKLAHESGERGGESGEEPTDGDGGLHLNRRKYVKLGAAAVAALTTSAAGGAAGSTASGTTAWTDFSEGSL
jgi:hypothetical protein